MDLQGIESVNPMIEQEEEFECDSDDGSMKGIDGVNDSVSIGPSDEEDQHGDYTPQDSRLEVLRYKSVNQEIEQSGEEYECDSDDGSFKGLDNINDSVSIGSSNDGEKTEASHNIYSRRDNYIPENAQQGQYRNHDLINEHKIPYYDAQKYATDANLQTYSSEAGSYFQIKNQYHHEERQYHRESNCDSPKVWTDDTSPEDNESVILSENEPLSRYNEHTEYASQSDNFATQQAEFLASEETPNRLQRLYDNRGDELNELAKKLFIAQKKISDLKCENGKLNLEKMQLDNNCKEFKNIVEEYEAHIRELKEKAKRVGDYEERERKLVRELEINKGQIENLEKLNEDLRSDDVLAKIKFTADEIIKKKEQDHSKEKKELNDEISSLYRKLKDLESENKDLQIKFDDLRNHKNRLYGDNPLHAQKLEEAYQSNRNLAQRNMELEKNLLMQITNTQQLTEKEAKINEIQAEKLRLEEEIKSLRRKNEAIHSQMDDYNKEKGQVSAMRNFESQEVSKLKLQVSNLNNNNAQFESEIRDLNNKLKQSQTEVNNYKKILDEKTENLKRLQISYNTHSTNEQHLLEKNKMDGIAVSELETKLNAVIAAKAILEKENHDLLDALSDAKLDLARTTDELNSQEMLIKLAIVKEALPPGESLQLEVAKALHFEDSGRTDSFRGDKPLLKEDKACSVMNLHSSPNQECLSCLSLSNQFSRETFELKKKLHECHETIHRLSCEKNTADGDIFKDILDVITQDNRRLRKQLSSSEKQLSYTKDQVCKIKKLYKEKCDTCSLVNSKYEKLEKKAQTQIDHYKSNAIQLSSKIKAVKIEQGIHFKKWLMPFRQDALSCIAEIIEKLNNINHIDHSILQPHLLALSGIYHLLEKLDIKIDAD